MPHAAACFVISLTNIFCTTNKKPLYLATSAYNQIAATILLHLVAALGTGLGVGVEPVCCLTVIAALPQPLRPSATMLTSQHIVDKSACMQLLLSWPSLMGTRNQSHFMRCSITESWTGTSTGKSPTTKCIAQDGSKCGDQGLCTGVVSVCMTKQRGGLLCAKLRCDCILVAGCRLCGMWSRRPHISQVQGAWGSWPH